MECHAAEKNSGGSIVVGLANRVELVVVAAGTGDGETEDGPAHDVDLLIDHVEKEFLAAGFLE